MIIATEFSPSASIDLREYVGAVLQRLDCLEEFIDFWFAEEGWSLTFMPLSEPEGVAREAQTSASARPSSRRGLSRVADTRPVFPRTKNQISTQPPLSSYGKVLPRFPRDLMLIRLKFFGIEIAKITVDSAVIQRLYPNARVITSFIRGVRPDAQFDVDYEGLEEWFAEHGFQMNECLCEHVGPRESLVPYVLLYALCDSTVVHLNAGCDSDVFEVYDEYRDDFLIAGLDLSRLVFVTGYYRESRVDMERVPLLMRSVFCNAGNSTVQSPEYSSSNGIRRGCSGVRFL